MPLGADSATRAGGSSEPTGGQRIQDDRRGQRGKNGSARPPGTHKLRCTTWRDGGIPASCGRFKAWLPCCTRPADFVNHHLSGAGEFSTGVDCLTLSVPDFMISELNTQPTDTPVQRFKC